MHKKSFFMLFFAAIFVLPLLLLSQEGVFDWGAASELHPGIRHAKFTVEQPRLMQINVARVDLDTPDLRLRSTGRDADWGKPMPDFPARNIRTRRQRTCDFIKQARRPVADNGWGLNMVFAINANPWSPWEKPFTHKYGDNLGLIISEGIVVSEANKRPSLVIYQDGTADLINATAETDLSKIVTAVSGFTFVLKDGKIIEGNKSLAPRTGFGLSANRRLLYLLTIDGRQPEFSQGSTTGEVGQWLLHLGAQTGLNMDDGGSTTMAVWQAAKGEAPEAIKQLNRHEKGWQRTVGCNLGVYYLVTP